TGSSPSLPPTSVGATLARVAVRTERGLRRGAGRTSGHLRERQVVQDGTEQLAQRPGLAGLLEKGAQVEAGIVELGEVVAGVKRAGPRVVGTVEVRQCDRGGVQHLPQGLLLFDQRSRQLGEVVD